MTTPGDSVTIARANQRTLRLICLAADLYANAVTGRLYSVANQRLTALARWLPLEQVALYRCDAPEPTRRRFAGTAQSLAELVQPGHGPHGNPAALLGHASVDGRERLLAGCAYCPGTPVHGPHRYASGSTSTVYECPDCGAFVGVHKPTPLEPVGTTANAELRKLRMLFHNGFFDPLWRPQAEAAPKLKGSLRRQAYQSLAEAMGLPVAWVHGGLFNRAQCADAMDLIASGQVAGAMQTATLPGNRQAEG